MILLVGGPKGGTGKSTIATNIAAELSTSRDVLLVDTDAPQFTAANWATRRKQTELSKVTCVQRTGDIFDDVVDLATRYAEVVIDAGGRDSEELRTALVCADQVCIPVRASQPDLDSLAEFLPVLKKARSLNRKLEVSVLVSMAPTHHRSSEVAEALDYIRGVLDLKALPVVVHERKVYRDAVIDGHGVGECRDDKAKHELKNLLEAIYG